MNSRERVIETLNHRQPDRVPVDLGATPVTGIAAEALYKLRAALQLENKPVKVHEPFQILGMVEEDVRSALKTDVVGIWAPKTFFGYKNENWKKWITPQGIEVMVGGGFTVTIDESGNTLIYPEGDTSAAPSAKLPNGGYYFDSLVRQEEIDEDNMNGREDFKEQFKVFSEEDLKHFEKSAEFFYKNTEYGIIANFAGAGIGDLAHIPGPGLKKTPGIRQADEWYMAHLLYPDYIKEVYNLQIEVALKNLSLLKEAVGDKIQAIFMSGTDFGTQRCEFMSPDMFREFYKPYFRKVNDWVHQNTNWKTFYHSCGSIVNLLDDIVESGVDILNPVQCSATGMEPKFLKEKYGDKLVFWGGGIDTQKTLPFGTVDEIKAEVTERLEILSENGGYVFNAIHNIQGQTPAGNLKALFDAVKEFNKLSLKVKQ
jgi:hypothetical protein